MKFMYVYILECKDGSYYTGVTNDLSSRLYSHNKGFDKDSYTYSRRPLKLKFQRLFDDPLSAIAFEKQLKGWSRAKKIALINRELHKLPGLSASQKKQ